MKCRNCGRNIENARDTRGYCPICHKPPITFEEIIDEWGM